MSENETEITAPRSFETNYVGDANFINFIRPHDESFPIPFLPSEYKISYTSTMESQIRKLRLSMETYRELMLNINSILLWERQWHPTATIGGCTVLFMLLWLAEPSILTVISILGLLITIGDYILPTLISSLLKSELWTEEKQKEYEDICTNIIIYKTKFELLLTSYYRMRITNPKMYFSITIFGLSFLAWIGSVINNLFLSYLLLSFLLLLPGLVYNGMLNKGSDMLSKIFNNLVENAKSKVGHKKIQ